MAHIFLVLNLDEKFKLLEGKTHPQNDEADAILRNNQWNDALCHQRTS